MEDQEQKLGWLEEIAEKSRLSKEVVKDVMDKYQIQQCPNIGIPKHLQIQQIKFTGVKEGKFTNEFEFEFSNLTPGVFGIISDTNFRGKTTILEVIKWLLRGNSSSLFQEGMKNWIRTAELKFEIDNNLYNVAIKQNDGIVNGSLFSLVNNQEKRIAEFNSNEEFESCMSEFMIDKFSLDKISAFRNSNIDEEVGKKVHHGWSSLASALFISTNYSSLFGDIVADGLNNRLMNMYLGLPWIPTYISLKTIENQLKSEAKVESIISDKEVERKKNRYGELKKELKNKREILKTTQSDKEIRDNLRIAREKYSDISSNITKLDRELRMLSEEYDIAKEAKLNDSIKLTNFKENLAANAVFKRLNPTCCPHCEHEIPTEKIEREKNEHLCAICDEPLFESENADLLLKELQSNLDSSDKVFEEIGKDLEKQKSYHKQLSISLENLHTEIAQLENKLEKFSERIRIEKDIERLEILLEEYEVELPKGQNSKTNIDAKVISKAIQVTKKKFEDLQIELLAKVNKEILRIAKFVGLDQIQSVELSSIPSLKIEKDGSFTSYSKCAEGEKLRLKVITTIALLSVAEKEQVGRHPGLLLIDSPGAQEVSDHDLNSLIKGLKELAVELPFVQIIIASRASNVILQHIDADHRKYATGNNYLW